MDKFLQWWKQDKRYMTLIKSVLFTVLPVLCCVVYCAARGKTIGQVYLPASEWNDELFYYKQVEGIVNFGYPQGYFGFNESHALKLSFAAWSPILVYPWVLWGLIFGWNLSSPVLCNIFLMALCCFLFVWLVKPSWKQMLILVLLFCLYTPFVRYMLSVMPEVICFSMLIVFYGLAINYLKRERTWKLALLFVMSGVMTLMRPYLLLFLLLPMYLWVKKSRWKGALGSAAIFLLTMGLYACIKHYLGAEYFAPLFFTDWVTAIFERGILGGLRFTAGKLYYMGLDFYRYTVQGIRTGLPVGAFFAGYLAMLCIFVFQWVRNAGELRRLRNNTERCAELRRRMIIEGHLAFSFVAMLFALLLMYKLLEGGRHLLTFMAAGLFVIAMMETAFYKKAVILGFILAYLFSYRAVDPEYYQVPFSTEEIQSHVASWTQTFGEKLKLVKEEVPSFENVVIWAFSDNVSGETKNTEWQLLYGLPEGFGISCCDPEYVLENFDSLKSRYLFAPAGGEIERRCREKGFKEIWRDEGAVLYQRY